MYCRSHERNLPRSNYLSQTVFAKTTVCSYILDRLMVQANGKNQLCCVDNNADCVEFGNASNVHPIEVVNGPTYVQIHELMKFWAIDKISPYKYCNVPIYREI